MSDMELLYADKRIAVAVKPPGILSTDEPGGMPELLRRQLGTPCIRTVHRLDAATGGVMVFARSAAAASILSGQVRDHQFRKTYLAVVRGDPGHSGTWRDLLGRDPVRRRTVVAQEPGPDVRPAELDFQRLASRDGLSLVRITLHTGRTHQIRVQFASRGFPLVGVSAFLLKTDRFPQFFPAFVQGKREGGQGSRCDLFIAFKRLIRLQ